jgi:hypothetical protein
VTTLRVALHRWTLVAIATWSLLLLVNEMFKGGSVGNPILCATDPRCGEGTYSVVATAAWVGGTLLILVLGYVFRPVRQPETRTKDKVVSLIVATGVLVLAGLAITLYQVSRPA